MRKKPTRMELFDGIYALLMAKDRGDMLFGHDEQGARDFFRRSLMTEGFPILYFEFPLEGDPCMDLIATYGRIEPGSRFSSGCGYGYQEVFDWFSRQQDMNRPAIGLELDLSQGETERAGIYIQPMGDRGLVAPFLEAVGQAWRAPLCLRAAERLPKGWNMDYVGLFPARDHTPLRLGGCLSRPTRQRCAQDLAFLASRLDLMGFRAYDDIMLRRCARLMELAHGVEYQIDVLPDGELGDTFGILVSFCHVRPHEVSSSFATGYVSQVMRTFEAWGLADSRWEHIAEAVTTRGLTYERDDGGAGQLAVSLRLDYAKVKFVGGVAQTAKFYLGAVVYGLR